MVIRLLQGDCRDVLRTIAADSVHCVVTSPPYWGLRDYGCDGQLGLEPTPEAYVANMVEVFREVRRVLRPDGVCWLNLGDSYATGAGKVGDCPGGGEQGERWAGSSGSRGERSRGLRDGRHSGKHLHVHAKGPMTQPNRMPIAGLKPKDLVGMPWSIAKALQQPYYGGAIKEERDRVWLAAIIDGEGTICGFTHERKDDGRTRTGVHVFVTNSCDAILSECHRIWPASRSEHMRPSAGHLGKKIVNRWIPHGAEKKALLLAEIYPYLISKKTQCLIAWNLLQFVQDGKRLGRGLHGHGVREKRALLARLLSDVNQGRQCDIPSWCVTPPSLHEQGWWLRSDIIWSKPNQMPESVTDRPTKAHEYVFLLTKSARYFYDAEAVKEPGTGRDPGNVAPHKHDDGTPFNRTKSGLLNVGPATSRNLRSVWTIATAPFSGEHFAVFPPALAETCIKAGTSERGCCPTCGAPWVRVVKRTRMRDVGHWRDKTTTETTGWEPGCTCPPASPVPCTVLDPFVGSGTSMLVADRLQRNGIGIDLNPEYVEMATARLSNDSPLFMGGMA